MAVEKYDLAGCTVSDHIEAAVAEVLANAVGLAGRTGIVVAACSVLPAPVAAEHTGSVLVAHTAAVVAEPVVETGFGEPVRTDAVAALVWLAAQVVAPAAGPPDNPAHRNLDLLTALCICTSSLLATAHVALAAMREYRVEGVCIRRELDVYSPACTIARLGQ